MADSRGVRGTFARMGMSLRLGSFRVLAIALLVGAPATAFAHIRWVTPVPRSQADGLKPPTFPAPCGNVARTTTPTVYTAGETITVKWTETIGHVGCYQVAFSPDDVNFVTLTQVVDPVALQGMQMTTVTLPAGVNCTNCTLQLRQVMLDNAANKTCAADAAPTGGGAVTYYSCADLCVGAGCPEAGAPAQDAGGNSSSGGPPANDSGPTTTPTDGGGNFVDGGGKVPGASPNFRAGAGDDGCSVGWGATSGFGFALGVGLFGIAIARRRRKGN